MADNFCFAKSYVDYATERRVAFFVWVQLHLYLLYLLPAHGTFQGDRRGSSIWMQGALQGNKRELG